MLKSFNIVYDSTIVTDCPRRWHTYCFEWWELKWSGENWADKSGLVWCEVVWGSVRWRGVRGVNEWSIHYNSVALYAVCGKGKYETRLMWDWKKNSKIIF